MRVRGRTWFLVRWVVVGCGGKKKDSSKAGRKGKRALSGKNKTAAVTSSFPLPSRREGLLSSPILEDEWIG